MAGLARVTFRIAELGCPWRFRGALLVAQCNTEAGDGLAHLQALGYVSQRMFGGREQVGAVGHAVSLDHFWPDCAGRSWSVSLFDRVISTPHANTASYQPHVGLDRLLYP